MGLLGAVGPVGGGDDGPHCHVGAVGPLQGVFFFGGGGVNLRTCLLLLCRSADYQLEKLLGRFQATFT